MKIKSTAETIEVKPTSWDVLDEAFESLGKNEIYELHFKHPAELNDFNKLFDEYQKEKGGSAVDLFRWNKETIVKFFSPEWGFSYSPLKYIFDDLYEEIKHGDEEHQKWLKDKMNEFLTKKIF